MNNAKMILEEILPFYFMINMLVIMFTSYVPTTFELYIVYTFAFAVAMVNNRLYSKNMKMHSWGEEALEVIDILEEENKILLTTIEELNNKIKNKGL